MAENSSTKSFGVSSSENREFSCPGVENAIWELDDSTSHQILIVVTSIACSLTVLLNLLVILAVMTRHELQKNSTILLFSLAVADLLVGALSMPFSITLDALVLQKHLLLVVDIFCTIDLVNVLLTYITCSISFYHLVVIAWERYVAVHKWREYKAIVTTGRLKKYAIISWLLSVLSVILSVAMLQFTGTNQDEIILPFEAVRGFFLCLGLFLLGYYYVNIYRGIRKWNRSQFRQVNERIKRKREAHVAFTTFLLTILAGVTFLPNMAISVLATKFSQSSYAYLVRSSFFRWADLMLQMNSLLNPILYFYRNHQLRRAALELLRIARKPKKIQRIQPNSKVSRTQLVQRTQHCESVLPLDFGKHSKCHRLERSQSCSALTYFDSSRGAQHVKPDKHCDSVASLEFGELKGLRSTSCGTVINVDKIYTVCDNATQPVNQTVTVQIESAARMKAMQSNPE